MNTCKKRPTKLFRTQNGIISYSEINEDFIVQYANLLIRLEPAGFISFKDFVHTLDLENCDHICEYHRCFLLKMPTNINFAFNKLEIYELRELTNSALGIYETIKMVQNCLDSSNFE